MALMVRIETCGVLFEIKLNKKKKKRFCSKALAAKLVSAHVLQHNRLIRTGPSDSPVVKQNTDAKSVKTLSCLIIHL